MAVIGTRRTLQEKDPNLGSLDKSPTGIARQAVGTPTAAKKLRRGGVANIVVMTLAAGIVGTMALPAYAFTPGSTDTKFGATASTRLAESGAQNVSVSAQAATVAVTRDAFTATTKEELAARAAAAAAAAAAAKAAADAAAAEARRQEVAEQMTSYAASYDGPSASEFVSAPAYSSVDLSSVFGVALQYQGVPYVYGGATPAGFDCSGFVMYVYAQFGVSMPHSAAGQGAMGTRIPLSEAQPGDLVIMDGHDGFYAGNGNILHAPYEGTSVRVQPLWTSDYYIVRI